jgi:outer membrane protein assembly factor BamB
MIKKLINSSFKQFLTASLIFLYVVLNGNTYAQTINDWPSFHGSDRTNKSSETGLLKEWPSAGPDLIWTVTGLGDGYSSVSVGDGLIYTEGQSDNQSNILCYDLSGKLVWKKPNGQAWNTSLSWASSYIGSRGTPTYDNGVVYCLSEEGRLTAFEAKTGKEKWSRELTKEFDADIPEYGYSESVLVDGNNLYVKPAGKKGYQVCLDKNTGKTIWANTDIPGTIGYNSGVIDENGGYRQLVSASSNYFYGIDTRTGKLIWKVDFVNQRELNLTDAVCFNDYVFLTSGYGKGCELIRLKPVSEGLSVEKVWQSKLMDNHHGGVILHNGFLYGSGSNSKGWFCLDFLTGNQAWKSEGKGSLTFADGMLYTLEERTGIMRLVKATPGKYEKTGEFKVPKGGESMYWAHPVVCGGRLYVRHGDKLFAYNLGKY